MGGRSIGLGRFGSPPMKSPPLPISRTNLESPVGASSDGEESEYGSSPSGQTSEPLAFSARRRSANCSRRAGSCAFRVSSPRSVRCLGCCSAVLFSLYFLMLHVSRPPFAQCASCLSTRSSSYICLSALFSSSRRLISQPSRRLRCCFIIVFLRSDPSRSSSSCRIGSRASARVFSFCSLRAKTSALTFFCRRITATLPLAVPFFFLPSDAVSSAFIASTAFAALVVFPTTSAATAAVVGAVADDPGNAVPPRPSAVTSEDMGEEGSVVLFLDLDRLRPRRSMTDPPDDGRRSASRRRSTPGRHRDIGRLIALRTVFHNRAPLPCPLPFRILAFRCGSVLCHRPRLVRCLHNRRSCPCTAVGHYVGNPASPVLLLTTLPVGLRRWLRCSYGRRSCYRSATGWAVSTATKREASRAPPPDMMRCSAGHRRHRHRSELCSP